VYERIVIRRHYALDLDTPARDGARLRSTARERTVYLVEVEDERELAGWLARHYAKVFAYTCILTDLLRRSSAKNLSSEGGNGLRKERSASMGTDRVDVSVDDLFGTLYWPPMPAMLVSSRDPDGSPHVAPFSLVYFASYTNVESVAPTDKIIILGIGGYATPETRKSKRTYRNIADSGEFVINVPPTHIVRQANRTGFWEEDKFAASGLTPIASAKVKTPSVAECMASFECEVIKVDHLESQADLFWGKVVAVRVDRELYEAPADQKIAMMKPLYHYGYSHDNGTWFSLGEKLLEEVESEAPKSSPGPRS